MPLLLDIDWSFFQQPFGGATVADYCWFAGIILATLLLRRPMSMFLSNISHNIASRISKEKHSEVFRSLLRKPFEWLAMCILFFIAIDQLSIVLDNIVLLHHNKGKANEFDLRLGEVIDHIFLFLIIISGTMVISRFIDFIYHTQSELAKKNNNRERQQLLPLVKEVVKLIVWSISFFWILGSVFHVNIPALITGLGIGGVAIALAAKESVENFFAAFTILSDKPFQVGDTIRIGSLEGMVERIGFRSTLLRNKDGSAYIIPNQKLVSENIENLTDRDAKGIHLDINIKYGVPHAQVTQMIDELKAMIVKTTHVKEPVEVAIENFGENTFRLAILYHLPYPAVGRTSDRKIKQEVNLNAYEIAYRYTGGNMGKIEDGNENKPSLESGENAEKKDDGLGGIL